MAPEFITKYVSCKDLHYYVSGQVKFGTLEHYRADERLLTEQRRNAIEMRLGDDLDEGKEKQIFSVPDGKRVGKISAPGIVLHGGNFKSVNIVNHIEINDWVFCASIGAYDRTHHKKMKEVNPDRQLTSYVVFDFAKLLRALDIYFRERYFVLQHAGKVPYLIASKVHYQEREIRADISQFGDVDLTASSQEDYERAVFSKPVGFKHEKEFRIVAGLNRPNFAPRGAQPVFPKSELIRKSMIPN